MTTYIGTENTMDDNKTAEIITVNTSNRNAFLADDDIYTARNKAVEAMCYEREATVLVISYNHIDKVKHCVESILLNTGDVDYKLLLVDNGCTDNGETLGFFRSVEHPHKQIIHITENMRAPLASLCAYSYCEGEFVALINDDIVVTPNWLSNMITCLRSDTRIGMVAPISSNTSNNQNVDFVFSDDEEMYKIARMVNKSDPKKWEERLRLITIAPVFRKACLDVVGPVFDTGFIHDFGDDDISFRIRRAGYKIILAKDVWVHHDHLNHEMSRENYLQGKAAFNQKYYGTDAWDDVNNYWEWIKRAIPETSADEKNILGIDAKCGSPILTIKNHLRSMGCFDAECYGFTENSRYYIDLQTFCGEGQVVCDRIESLLNYFNFASMDYIVIGSDINVYASPIDVIINASRLLKDNGRLFVSLYNVYNIMSLANILGMSDIFTETTGIAYTVELFEKKVREHGLDISVVEGHELNIELDSSTEEVFRNMFKMIAGANLEEAWTRANCDRIGFVISRSLVQ